MRKQIIFCYPPWLELIPLALILFALFHTVSNYSLLPDTIPAHFGANGTPDGWSQKTFFSSFAIPLIGLVVYLATALLNLFLVMLPSDPGRFINIPQKQKEALGPERLENIRVFIARSLWALNAVVTASIAYLAYGAVNTSLGRWSGLGWVMWLFFFAIIVVTFWMVIRLFTLTIPPKKKI
ncbi:MAG: DUF1648 domain-containing protein [Bacillota bacterium]